MIDADPIDPTAEQPALESASADAVEAPADDLSSLLSQWKANPGIPEESEAANRPAATQPPAQNVELTGLQGQIGDLQRKLSEISGKSVYSDPEMLKLAMTVDGIAAFTDATMRQLHAQEMQRIDAADGAELIEECKSALGDMTQYVSDDWIRRWLLSEYHINGQVKEAWDNRRNPGVADQAVDRLKRMIGRMVKDARKMPSPIDHEATDARAAVTAAVRSGSRSFIPEENSAALRRRMANMSDAEFQRHKEETYGL